MDIQVYDSAAYGGPHPITVGYRTDKGRKRSGNEDSYAVFSEEQLGGRVEGLYVVADGMGGTRGGEIASNIVINSLPEAVQAGLDAQPEAAPPQAYANLLERSVQHANGEVWNYKQRNEGLQHMGTTCVAALIAHAPGRDKRAQGFLVLANVGDSRAYLLRGGKLSQITEDHSTVWEQVKAGHMTPEQANSSRFRNEITRAMGLRSTVKPDITIHPLEAGDVLLMCSDGLTTEADDLTIARLLAGSADPQTACDRLLESALEHGGSDNVTVVVVHYGAFAPLATDSPAPEPLANRWEDEEDVTDPNQAWKRSLSSTQSARREPLDDHEDRFATPARDRYREDVAVPRHGVSPVLFGLLLLVALGEAVGLYLFWNGKIPTATPSPKPIAALPTDKPLKYEHPLPLYWQDKLWDGVLNLMPDGRLLVVTLKGQELAITSGGKPTVLGNTAVLPPQLPAPKRLDGTTRPTPILPYVAVDGSGNRYELNPTTRAIDKYDPSGVLQTHNIGQDALLAPSNLVVDKLGNIYVIDSHMLKKFVAVPDTGQTATRINKTPTPDLNASGQAAKTSTPVVEPTH